LGAQLAAFVRSFQLRLSGFGQKGDKGPGQSKVGQELSCRRQIASGMKIEKSARGWRK